MSSETYDFANVDAEVLPILNSYADMVKHPVKALALLRDKECISFLILQLTGEDEEVVGLALRILYTLSTSLGHHKHELAETFGYRNSLELVIKRFHNNEAYMTYCKQLLDIAPKSTATRKHCTKPVKVYFYEPVNDSTRNGLTSDFTRMKGIVSVAFNMSGSVCNLRVTKEVKKTEVVEVLINNGIHSADLGLFRDGKEERIAVGKKEEEAHDLPDYLPDDYVPSPEKENNGQHILATKEQLHMPPSGTSGFRSLWKGVTSFLDTYF